MGIEEKKEPTFEQNLAELEEILHKLEAGEQKLEDSIMHYEQGMKLLKRCYKMLEELEGKVVKLVKDSEGGINEEP